ncbi:hypothetical protein [Desulfurella sp.]|uniref:hypothetical protein n=1 Tax=Desulfurella sp. TaxID=1962857 RepID=UPI0025C0AC9F|nr:hypothetical protein [Desulfurella sp.]
MFELERMCVNSYKKAKQDLLGFQGENIVENLDNLIQVIDNCAEYLTNFQNFESSIEEILQFLLKRKEYYLEWINILAGKLLENFQNTSEDQTYHLFNAIEKLSKNCLHHFDKTQTHEKLFLMYAFLFIMSAKKINSIDYIDKIISMAKIDFTNKPEKEKLLTTWIIIETLSESKEIKWEEKSNFFWDWQENPYFNFFKDYNTTLNILSSIILTDNKVGGYSLEEYYYSYIFLQLIHSLDSKLSEKEKSLFKEKVFTANTNRIFKELHEILADKDTFYLSELEAPDSNYLLLNCAFEGLSYLHHLNKDIIPFISQSERKKIEEIYFLYWLCEYYKNSDYALKTSKILKTETPDFILETKTGYRIGIELIAMETEEEFKERSGYSATFIDPKEITSSLVKQIRNKINKKQSKCLYKKRKKELNLNELWLYLHLSFPSETLIKRIVASSLDKDFNKKVECEIKTDFDNKNKCFDKILYYGLKGEIIEIELEKP